MVNKGRHKKILDLPPKGARIGSEVEVIVVTPWPLGCVRDGYDQPVFLKVSQDAIRDPLFWGVDA